MGREGGGNKSQRYERTEKGGTRKVMQRKERGVIAAQLDNRPRLGET